MHFDVALSVFIHPCTKKAEESSIQYSSRVDVTVCVHALQMCAQKNLSLSTGLLLQQSPASFRLNENARVGDNA